MRKMEIPTRKENSGEAILPDIAATILEKLKKESWIRKKLKVWESVYQDRLEERGEVPCAVNLHWGRKKVTKELGELTGLA